jgi:hypothetical protein
LCYRFVGGIPDQGKSLASSPIENVIEDRSFGERVQALLLRTPFS